MYKLVIDASVIVKALVPEMLSEKASDVMAAVATGKVISLAPDLVYFEVANAVCKKYRRQELSRDDVTDILEATGRLRLAIEPSLPILPIAVDIALDARIAVYDATYVAVATLHDAKVITADKKFADSLARTGLAEYVQWLGTVKAP